MRVLVCMDAFSYALSLVANRDTDKVIIPQSVLWAHILRAVGMIAGPEIAHSPGRLQWEGSMKLLWLLTGRRYWMLLENSRLRSFAG